MSHPFNQHRDHKVQRERVSHIAHGHKHRKDGGRVHSDAAQDRKLIREEIQHHDAEGKKAKHRRDRPMRAKGGKVGHKKGSHVNVNVITGGHGQPQPVPVPMPPPAAGPPMPPPGLGAPAPGGPPPMGGLPPGMPPRKRGGRITSDGHTAKPMRAKGGSLKSGPAWEEGRKAGTQVQHSDALSVTEKNMNRPKVVTFKSGGAVKKFTAYARGGKVEAPQGVAKATKLSGGAGGGIGRREKAKEYGGRPMREVDGAR